MAPPDGRRLHERLLDGWLSRSELVCAAWSAWLRFRNERRGNRPSEIEPGCWIAAEPTRRRWRELTASGGSAAVTHVVSLVGETPPPPWLASAATVLWLPVRDRAAPTPAQLRTGVEFLDAARAAGHGVLVFCGGGAGRSATLYAAWLMTREKATAREAIALLQNRRPRVSPTRRQMAALESWAREGAARGA